MAEKQAVKATQQNNKTPNSNSNQSNTSKNVSGHTAPIKVEGYLELMQDYGILRQNYQQANGNGEVKDVYVSQS
ncbi:MAG TPA: hypothetical protein ENJ78_00060, partial [candidate division WWE3 bacterium]|nr:hypothetical protein [candidate division WWE3 bacterium]